MRTILFSLFSAFGLFGQTAIIFSEITILGVPPTGTTYTQFYRLRVSPNGTVITDTGRQTDKRAFLVKKPESSNLVFLSDNYIGLIQPPSGIWGEGLIAEFLADDSGILVSVFTCCATSKFATSTSSIPFTGPAVLLYINLHGRLKLDSYIGIFPGADKNLYTYGWAQPRMYNPNPPGVYKHGWATVVSSIGGQGQDGEFDLVFKTDAAYDYKSVWKLASGDFLAERQLKTLPTGEIILHSATGTLKQVITSSQVLGFTPTECCTLVVDLPKQAALIGLRNAQSQFEVVRYSPTGIKEVYTAKSGQPISGSLIPIDLKGDWALLLGASIGTTYDTLLRINISTGEQVVVATHNTPVLGQNVISLDPELVGIAGNGDVYLSVNNKLAKATVVTPSPAAPIISKFEVAPTSVESGQSATINWSVTGLVTEVSLDQQIGVVAATDSRQVTPKATTTYTLVAKGPGGIVSKQVILTVTSVAPSGPIISSIIHGATLQTEPLAPGMIITIEGQNFGQDTTVLFDGQQLPVDFISPRQISASLLDSADASIADHSITVVSSGVSSASMPVKIVPQNFAAFMVTDSVSGQQLPTLTDENGNLLGDPSLNSPNLTQAHAGGQVITIGTGGGQALDVDGNLYPDAIPDAPGPYQLLNVPSVQLDGVNVTPVYAGRVIGTRSKDQITVQLPAEDIPSGQHSLRVGDRVYRFWVGPPTASRLPLPSQLNGTQGARLLRV